MNELLISLHSLFRWLVLLSLYYTLFRAGRGYLSNGSFTRRDNFYRHWTATIAHIQLVIGFTLYFKSPVVQFFFSNMKVALRNGEISFFAIIHILSMVVAIVIITIGSALAKRRKTDREKFKTMFAWFLAGLIIIFITIPWPFSPFANRPYIRTF